MKTIEIQITHTGSPEERADLEAELEAVCEEHNANMITKYE